MVGLARKADVATDTSALLVVRQVQSRMSSHLEKHSFRSLILHLKVGFQRAPIEVVAHFEAKRIGKYLSRGLRSFEEERHALRLLFSHLPGHILRKTMLRNVVGTVANAALTVPKAARDGEKDGAVATPKSGVALPDVLAPRLGISQTCCLCTFL